MTVSPPPETSPLKPLTTTGDPFGVGALSDAAEDASDSEASVAELQSIRDLRLELEKTIGGGRGRPSARTLRLRAERARELAGYLSPTVDPSMMPPGYTPTTVVAHGCGTPTTKNAEFADHLAG